MPSFPRSLAMAAVCWFVHWSPVLAATDASCPAYPPVLAVSGAVIYKDRAGSVSDAQGAQANKDALAPIDDFLGFLGHALDEKTGPAELACPYGLLRQWAAAGALLRPPLNTPGRVARVWISPAVGFIVLKFKLRGVQITPDVGQWLDALAAAEREDYGKPLTKGVYAGLYSNTYPWVGAANALAALVAANPAAVRFQDEAWTNMLAQIRPDGTLQGELGRGHQALEYHVKAAAGLLIMRSARLAMGIADDPAQIARLKLLLTMVGNALCHPESLAAAAGAALNTPGVYAFRIPLAFSDGLLPDTWTSCGPKEMNWFQAEYSGGDARVSAEALAAAANAHARNPPSSRGRS